MKQKFSACLVRSGLEKPPPLRNYSSSRDEDKTLAAARSPQRDVSSCATSHAKTYLANLAATAKTSPHRLERQKKVEQPSIDARRSPQSSRKRAKSSRRLWANIRARANGGCAHFHARTRREEKRGKR